MRRTCLWIGIASGLVLLGGWSVTGQEKKSAKEQPKAERSTAVETDKFIKEHDKNKDGYLSRDEMPKEMRDGFARIDTNNDSKLSRQELLAHAARMQRRVQPLTVTYIWIYESERDELSRQDLQQAYELLRKLDGDKDGKITAAEIKTARNEVIEKMIDCRIAELDSNSDGKLSRDEVRRWAGLRFEVVDQNNDGMITRAELIQAATQGRDGFTVSEEEPIRQ